MDFLYLAGEYCIQILSLTKLPDVLLYCITFQQCLLTLQKICQMIYLGIVAYLDKRYVLCVLACAHVCVTKHNSGQP